MRAPTGVRILISMAVMRKRQILHADVDSPFLQTGATKQSMYEKPPKQSDNMFRFLGSWLLALIDCILRSSK